MRTRSAIARPDAGLVAGALLALVIGLTLSAATPSRTALGGCPVFPADNIWNTRIDHLPVHPSSGQYVRSIGLETGVHPDFGSGLWDGKPIGIPYNVVPGSQPKVGISFYYPAESDRGPYPIPANPKIEGGSDRHILVVQRDTCRLYEVYDARRRSGNRWSAGSGAVWNLRSNTLRRAGWTSADAAGLSILAGLVRYEEVSAGAIRHAVRFTASRTRRAYVWPARHFASDITSRTEPPMGQRFRLKASFDISRFSPQVRVILTAFKRYGLVLADNGADWYVSGAPDPRWNNDVLVPELREVTGADFEAVDATRLMISPGSGAARQPGS